MNDFLWTVMLVNGNFLVFLGVLYLFKKLFMSES